MNWLKQNLIQLITILVVVTFGYANFTADIKANATAIKTNDEAINKRVDKYEEKIDKAIKLLERIDERTKKL